MAEAPLHTTTHSFTTLPDPLRCPICSQCIQYATCLSPCMHTFCRKCISQIDKTEIDNISGISCPVCSSFSASTCIRPNDFMNTLVENILIHKTEMADNSTQFSQCMQCGNPNVVAFCRDCEDNLCQNCKNRHVRLKGFQSHNVIPLSEVDGDDKVFHITGYCTKHPDNPVELYCLVCNEAICTPCKYKDHIGHKTEGVKNALLKLKETVAKDLSIIKNVISEKENVLCTVENQIEDMSHNKSEIYSQIISRKNYIIKYFTQLVNEEFEKLVRNLDDIIDSQVKEKEIYKDSIECNLSCDKNVYAWVRTIVNKTDGSGLVKELQSGLLDKMKHMKCPPLHKTHEINLCEFVTSDIAGTFNQPILGVINSKTGVSRDANEESKEWPKVTVKYELQKAMENSILSSDEEEEEMKGGSTGLSTKNTTFAVRRPHLVSFNTDKTSNSDSDLSGSTGSDDDIPIHTVKELTVNTKNVLHSGEVLNDKPIQKQVFNSAANNPDVSKSESRQSHVSKSESKLSHVSKSESKLSHISKSESKLSHVSKSESKLSHVSNSESKLSQKTVRQEETNKKLVKPVNESSSEDIGPKHNMIKALKSFRVCDYDLRILFDKQLHHIKDIKIKSQSFRLCVIKNQLWVPCIQEKLIKIVSLSGSIKTIHLHNIHQPRVLHPIKSQRIALAARSGLYILDQIGQIKLRIHKGEIQDVHSDGFVMAAIEKNRIHIWEVSEERYIHTNTFTVGVNPQYCNTFLISHPYIFVGDFRGCSILRYSVTGQSMGQYEAPSVSLRNPTLCMRDSNENVLVATYKSNRLKVLSHTGELICAIPVDAQPWDVVIVGNTLCVLCETDKILLYKI